MPRNVVDIVMLFNIIYSRFTEMMCKYEVQI